jgi:hypothetical protein
MLESAVPLPGAGRTLRERRGRLTACLAIAFATAPGTAPPLAFAGEEPAQLARVCFVRDALRQDNTLAWSVVQTDSAIVTVNGTMACAEPATATGPEVKPLEDWRDRMRRMFGQQLSLDELRRPFALVECDGRGSATAPQSRAVNGQDALRHEYGQVSPDSLGRQDEQAILAACAGELGLSLSSNGKDAVTAVLDSLGLSANGSNPGWAQLATEGSEPGSGSGRCPSKNPFDRSGGIASGVAGSIAANVHAAIWSTALKETSDEAGATAAVGNTGGGPTAADANTGATTDPGDEATETDQEKAVREAKDAKKAAAADAKQAEKDKKTVTGSSRTDASSNKVVTAAAAAAKANAAAAAVAADAAVEAETEAAAEVWRDVALNFATAAAYSAAIAHQASEFIRSMEAMSGQGGYKHTPAGEDLQAAACWEMQLFMWECRQTAWKTGPCQMFLDTLNGCDRTVTDPVDDAEVCREPAADPATLQRAVSQCWELLVGYAVEGEDPCHLQAGMTLSDGKLDSCHEDEILTDGTGELCIRQTQQLPQPEPDLCSELPPLPDTLAPPLCPTDPDGGDPPPKPPGPGSSS